MLSSYVNRFRSLWRRCSDVEKVLLCLGIFFGALIILKVFILFIILIFSIIPFFFLSDLFNSLPH